MLNILLGILKVIGILLLLMLSGFIKESKELKEHNDSFI
jgi:hypothetical protein